MFRMEFPFGGSFTITRSLPDFDAPSYNPETVKKLLDDGDAQAALKEALKGDLSLEGESRNESLKKIAEFHLGRNEILQAKQVIKCSLISTVRDEVCEKIFEIELANNDLVGAEETADLMHREIPRDEAFTEIFGKKLEKKDFQGALFTALKTSVLQMAKLLEALFKACMESQEYSIAKQALKNINYRNEEHEESLNTILDAELANNDLAAAVETDRMLYTRESAQKIIDALLNRQDNLEKLKEADRAFLGRSIDSYTNSDLVIFDALKSGYEKFGQTEDVQRMKRNIFNLKESLKSAREGEVLKEKVGTFFRCTAIVWGAGGIAAALGADPLGLAISESVGIVGLLGIPLSDNLKIYRTENTLGAGAGMIASVGLGMSLPSSVGIGLGTALVTRMPIVQSLAKGALHLGASSVQLAGKAALGSIELLGEAGVDLVNRVLKAGARAHNALTSSINALDSGLDTIACR